MKKQQPYKQEGYGEGQAGNINPAEVGRVEPSKRVEEREPLGRRESWQGSEMSQSPADEHIESFSQIDDDTNWMSQEHDEAMRYTESKQFDTDDFKRVDERDNNDSSKDWDAERSRTGRQK